MTLGELIERLEKEDQTLVVPMGWGYPHSYRGNYCDLAFEPKENVSVAEMLSDAKESLGKTFVGYKGGDFEMDEFAYVYIAHEGCCGDGLSHLLLDYMFGKYRVRP